ncbi:MAG: deoxyribonuclease IV [Thermincola sp.]|jgi:deoxyribonuclease-4|nr:deoxyribonuclease IV [Thermincola sp.]MDT3701730.1 deoxyribonuclease IV [Thermincola sp.]
MRLGIHTSISGGFDKAVARLVKLGCNACQMFSRSPRGGKARALGENEVRTFRDLCNQHDINPVAVHIPYVLNLAAAETDKHDYAVAMVKEDMERANLLGASYLVLHMGSHRGAGKENGLQQVARVLNRALADYDGETVLLLENTSGAGGEVGSTFEELRMVLDQVKTPKTGICFDTCHGFAAGYDLAGFDQVQLTIGRLEQIVGIDKLKLIHLNDSMFPLGSSKDRHADIGSGHIGEEGFKAILQQPKLTDIPLILETPADKDEDWLKNLNTVRRLGDF